MTGDFNFHYEKDSATGVAGLKNILAENNLEQHVSQSTHRMGHMLDLVITRKSDHTIAAIDVSPSSISDHHSIIFNVLAAVPPPVRQQQMVRDHHGFDKSAFQADLATRLSDVDVEQVVESLLRDYQESVRSIVDKHAPLVRRNKQLCRCEPWYNEEIHHAQQLRHTNEKRWRQTKLEVHRQIFVEHRAQVNTMITQAKRDYYETVLSQGKKSDCFRVVNKMVNGQGARLPDTSSTENLCQNFASFFENKIAVIREKICNQIESEGLDTHDLDILFPLDVTPQLSELRSTTEHELAKIIRKCNSKTCDLDSCPTELLKDTLDVHLPYLTAVVNGSFRQGLFPHSLRTAIVKPLLKRNGLDGDVLANYRPVSNIPFCSKLLEKVAVGRLMEHLTRHGLLEEHQSAYRGMHSTETALLRVQHDIASALDNNQAVALVMLDFSAAFDTIDQGRLLQLLEAEYGVIGTALSWFRTYLESRTQQVQIDSVTSNCVPLRFGVPQGSVLGPLIFTLYTAPMQRIIHRHGIDYHKFADDMQLYTSFDPSVPGDRARAVEQLTICISELRRWLTSRWLKLNDSKTELIFFMSKHHLQTCGQATVSIGDSKISAVSCVRNLGVQMDQHLSMVPQVTAICAACNYHLHRLSSIRRYLTTEATKTLIQALITTRIDYCSSLLVNIPAAQLKRLQLIQNKAARLVTRTSVKHSITPILKGLHWLPVTCRISYKVLVTAFKCIHGLAPTYLSQLLTVRDRDSRLRGADAIALHQPLARKSVGMQAFGHVAPILWNGLPAGLRTISTIV